MAYNETVTSYHYPSKGTTMFKILIHTVLTFVTGGLWLIVLLVRHLVKN